MTAYLRFVKGIVSSLLTLHIEHESMEDRLEVVTYSKRSSSSCEKEQALRTAQLLQSCNVATNSNCGVSQRMCRMQMHNN